MAEEDSVASLARAPFRWWAVLLGPVLAVVAWWITAPDGFDETAALTPAGRATLAMLVWMATWWVTEAIDLTATALLPVVCFPLLGIASARAAMAPYADPVIFLFMGSFMVALAMQRWDLGLRVSLLILLLCGTNRRSIVAGIMGVTALFSMFVSNTATVAMMLPIVISIVAICARQSPSGAEGSQSPAPALEEPERRFASCLLLGTAYASSIGGIATIIGTPPNVFLVSFLAGESLPAEFRMTIPFVEWAVWGVPFSLLFLGIAWTLLVLVQFRVPSLPVEGGRQLLRSRLAELGPPAAGEWWTLAAFVAMVVFWVARPWLEAWELSAAAGGFRPFAGLSDTVIAVAAGLVLFMIPCRLRPAEAGGKGGRTTVLDWATARRMPWSALLLFGGGMSLASAAEKNQVAEYLGHQLRFLTSLPETAIVLIVVTLVVYLTEVTGNLAVVAAVLPVLAGLALECNMHPAVLAIPAAMGASCAFMLPVATPPNAIVFGSGRIHLVEMVRAGWWLNLAAIGLITLSSATIIRWCLKVP